MTPPARSLVVERERIVGALATTPDRGRTAPSGPMTRPEARGKFLFVGDTKFWVKGVTYGTFGPGEDGLPFPARDVVDDDFAAMADRGFNVVRVYTPPLLWLLDLAQAYGLRVIVGLPWEQHIAFLEEKKRDADIVERLRRDVAALAGHPALLCYAIGNEIPAGIVRWHGRRRIERFLHRLYSAAKAEDPTALVTYVNFPTTEYLRLPFLDLQCFNVYLESRERLEAYLARLQNLAGEKPLLMAEIGLDSRRNGVDAQAASLAWQIEASFAAGCVGATIFAWTDEWHRGGHPIEDWDFGLVTREREPKPALDAVTRAFAEAPFRNGIRWPRVSVVVATLNGARTIRDTMEGLRRLEYPDFEVIVVNDGSTDATPRIVAEYPECRLINTPNNGLSTARNIGWQAASGEIIAYIDDDAWPDPHWLHYLAYRFITGDWVGVGGWNIAPPGDGPIADCIANAPGGPVHVLVSDTEAEHIPGCNMAFRRSALEAIDGFDPRYRAAGDDVDVCWRLQQAGGKIGFHAGAMDWHHRRNSMSMYWKQQTGYGKAEALLEEKWPERYSPVGHLSWSGRLYGRGFQMPITFGRAQIYGGVWGTAGYQSLYDPAPLALLWLPLMPEWYLVILALGWLSLLGIVWTPLLLAAPLFALALAAPLAQAAIAATRARFPIPARGTAEKMRRWTTTFTLHMMQPVARLIGRFKHGLTPWRRRLQSARPVPAANTLWSETWKAPEQWIGDIEAALRNDGAIVTHGGSWDQWDLSVRGGLLGHVNALVAVEEHGAGKQLVRLRTRTEIPVLVWVLMIGLAAVAIAALANQAWLVGVSLAAACAALAIAADADCDTARLYWNRAVRRVTAKELPTTEHLDALRGESPIEGKGDVVT